MRYKLALIISLLINFIFLFVFITISETYLDRSEVNLLELRVKSLENSAIYFYQANKLGTYERDQIVNSLQDLVGALRATGVFFRDPDKPKQLPVVQCAFQTKKMKKRRKRRKKSDGNKMMWMGGDK